MITLEYNARISLCFVLGIVLFSAGPFAYAQEGDDSAVFELTPSFLFVGTKGDREKFEEDAWTSRNASGGLSGISFSKKLSHQDSLEFEGRAIAGNNDFDADFNLSREGVGSLVIAFKEFRKFYDGTGGFYAPFASLANFPVELDKDIHLDIGSFKIEGILAKENSPEYSLSYEREFRDGAKSLVSWGTVTGSVSRKVNPTFIYIDEVVDKFKLGIKWETNDSEAALQQSWEKAKSESSKINNQTLTLSTGALSSVRSKFENSDSDLYTTVLRFSKDLNKKAFVSFGLLYNHYIGGSLEQITDTGTSSSNENHPLNPAAIEQDAVTFLPNISLLPFKDLMASLGLKAEFVTKKGDSAYNRDYRTTAGANTPDGAIDEFVNIESDTLQKRFSGFTHLKYNGIKNAVFYAELGLERQLIDQFENQDSFGPNPASGSSFSRKTNTVIDKNDFTLGCKWYPAPKLNITLENRYKTGFIDNEHKFLTGDVVSGYRGFMDSMAFDSYIPGLKLNYRPFRWLAYNLAYAYDKTIYVIRTRASSAEEAAKYRAHVYSGEVTFSPYDYLYLSLFFQKKNAVTKTRANGESGSLVTQPNYNANFDVLRLNCSYGFSKSTTIEGGYAMYKTENFDDFSGSGLPLGLDNFSHDIFAGLKRSLGKGRSLEFRYTYKMYNENSNNNIDDYEAHLFYAAMKIKF